MVEHDGLAFLIGYVVSLLIAAGIYLSIVWSTLAASLEDLDYIWVSITAFACVIPAMLSVLLNTIIKD